VRILLDTGIWFRFVRRLPQAQKLQAGLEDPDHNKFLSAISSMEIIRKWQTGRLPCPNPEEWIDDALEGFEIIPVNEGIARRAALWDWEHRDPSDRLIAATALVHRIELWHSDTILAKLEGFPQRYFKAVALD
jgi:PIN domain nuclease of toxin-antitoxin system